MSIIVDDLVQSKEELEASDNEDQVQELENEINDDIPDKFKGKQVGEVVKAYTELEKRFGQQGNELGELRRLTDDILKRKIDEQTKEEVTEEDFYDNPTKSVEKIVESHPGFKRLDDLERSIQEKEFTLNHPSWRQEVSDPEFINWVSSSKARINLYQKANSFDFSSANDLFDLWDERKAMISEASNNEETLRKNKREKELKDATSESSTTESTTKKIFRRNDLMKMRLYEPEEYAARQDEIMLAYAEGRVK